MFGFKQKGPAQNVLAQKLRVLQDKLGQGVVGEQASEGERVQKQSNRVVEEMAADAPAPEQQTLADDGVIDVTKQEQIKADEALVRAVLQMFGANYDALITLDGESVYAQAVQANPAILQEVLQSERPVLAALEVVQAFKPVAEFHQQYGKTPQEIKDNMRKELKTELAQVAEESVPQERLQPLGAVFSRPTGGAVKGEKPRAGQSLTEIFRG